MATSRLHILVAESLQLNPRGVNPASGGGKRSLNNTGPVVMEETMVHPDSFGGQSPASLFVSTTGVSPAVRRRTPSDSPSGPRWMRDLDASDHRSYWAEGYLAVMVADTVPLNPHYPSPGDTADTIDDERMAGVATGDEHGVAGRDD